jgi:hypothetical protein
LEELGITNNPLTVDADFFLEILINSVRNDTVSFQNFVSKSGREHVNALSQRINVLKNDFILEQNTIFSLEREISEINDRKLKEEVDKFRSFDCLNKEKITPYTLKLLKVCNNETKLSDIRDNNNENFRSISDQSEFIRETFAKIYRPNFDESKIRPGCIEEFLGKEILQHKVVAESKLTLSEKNKLDSTYVT